MSILKFRSILRDFEREIAIQNNNCCNTGISFAQCHLLLDIEKLKSTSVKELSEVQGLDKSTISRTIDSLYNQSLINREVDSSNRRQSIINLTKEGKSICNQINGINNDFFGDIFTDLSKEETLNFLKAFEKITLLMRQKRENITSSRNCCQ